MPRGTVSLNAVQNSAMIIFAMMQSRNKMTVKYDAISAGTVTFTRLNPRKKTAPNPTTQSTNQLSGASRNS